MYRGIRRCPQRRGNLLQTRRGQRLIRVNKALDYAKAAFPNYQWGVNAVILEPRPVVKDETLYWMATITNADKAGSTRPSWSTPPNRGR